MYCSGSEPVSELSVAEAVVDCIFIVDFVLKFCTAIRGNDGSYKSDSDAPLGTS